MAAVITGLEGCASPSQRKEQAAKLLHEKYQEEFEIISYKEARLFENYFTVMAYASEYPDLIFKASIDNDLKGVSDSYVTKRLCDRISDKISQNLGTLESEHYVFTEAMFSDSLVTDPEISLEAYVQAEPANKFTIYLCLEQDGANAENIVSSLAHMMDGISDISGSVSIYLADSSLMLEIQQYVTSHDNTYGEFDEMVEKARIGSVEFENSNFSLTEDTLKKMAGDRL